MSSDRNQPENDEVVSLNADDLDAGQLDQLNQESLEDVAGGSCSTLVCNELSCGVFSQP